MIRILFSFLFIISNQLYSKVRYDEYKAKSYFVKRSVLLNKKIYKGLHEKRVADYTSRIFETWYRYKDTKLKHIKNPKYPIALVHSESNFRPRVISSAKCIGLFQLDIKTARWICKKYGIPSKNLKNRLLNDVGFNILVGLCNLNEEIKNADGKIDEAILSYKVGSGIVRRKQITRRHIDLYSKFYCYSKFIDGDKDFKNPNKYYYIMFTHLNRA